MIPIFRYVPAFYNTDKLFICRKSQIESTMSANYEENLSNKGFINDHEVSLSSDNKETRTLNDSTNVAGKPLQVTTVATHDDVEHNSDDLVIYSKDDGNTTYPVNTLVVAMHYNELKEAGLKERRKSKIFFMRNFNNWIKSQLINEYMALIKQQKPLGEKLRVLDMCCGKGGDLLKWEKAAIAHLICTDIAEVSVDQCRRRYMDILSRAEKSKYANKFTAEFFACDSTLVRLRERYEDVTLQLNLVSCQFAFHYCFESLSQAECMVRNAAECLQPGGYFIATIPDAYEIVRRLQATCPASRKFGNQVYSIEFVCETEPLPLFGAKYQFNLEGVVDCPEFVVHFPTLVKLCRKYGLKLERRTSFADYYKETVSQGRQLLQRMSGLESVQPNRCVNDEQYTHIRIFHGSHRGRSLGTLSRDEWEAATLYLVCAFKKCKNSWTADAKPLFEFDD